MNALNYFDLIYFASATFFSYMVAFFTAATTLIIAQCDFNNLQICTSFLHINMFCVIVTNDEKMELFRYIFPPGADLDFYKILQEKLWNFKLVILLQWNGLIKYL